MLKIELKGPAGCGKTVAAQIIHKALAEAGYTVAHTDDGISPGCKVLTPDSVPMPAGNDGRIANIHVEAR